MGKTRYEEGKEMHYRNSPLYAGVLLGIDEVETKSLPTMATDGKTILHNPGFIETLSLNEIDTAFCHEISHIMHKHPFRRPKHLAAMEAMGMEKCAACLNITEDCIINVDLQDEKKAPLPGWMHDARAKDKTVLEFLPTVYKEHHHEHQGQQGQGQGDEQDPSGTPQNGPGSPGQGKGCCQPSPDMTEAEAEEMEKKVDEAILRAARIAKSRGHIPAWAERLVDKISKPRVRWEDHLNEWLTAKFPSDYSWAKPSKRGFTIGAYLPRLSEPAMDEVAIFVDTSGSIDDNMLAAFGAEIQAFFSRMKPVRLHVLYIDSAVAKYQVFDRADELKLKAGGGGCTSFRPGYQYLKDKEINVRGCIYLTDLYGDWKEMDDPGVDTLFVSTTPKEQAKDLINPKWGRITYMDMDHG